MSDENRTNEIYDAATEEEQREAERHKARKERAERMREEKRRSMMIRRYGTIGVVALVSLIVLITVVVKQKDKINPREIPSATEMASEQLQATETEQPTVELRSTGDGSDRGFAGDCGKQAWNPDQCGYR